jgi:3-carboxy-cis,cis-muconate cycloisomerase
MSTWTDAFASTPALADVMSAHNLVRHMLAFEAALGLALSQAEAAPAQAGEAIAAACADLAVDEGALFADGAKASTLAIPLVKLLTAAVRARDPAAAAWVHFGATSQDVVDTALVLQLDEALTFIEADLDRLGGSAARLAETYRRAPMLGRTLLQPATPIPFGLKAAQWLAAARDCRRRLRRSASEALVVQFGGASGNLGSLGTRAEKVAARLNVLLAPARSENRGERPALPWHARRGNLAALAADLGIMVGVCAKIARDVSLMMQFEVSEATEPSKVGRGGSSAMPHKRNPVLCMFTLSAAARAPQLVATLLGAMAHEHERALGGWQAEWATLPELVKLSGAAVANMAETLAGLAVDQARMRTNLEALHGLPMTEMASLSLASKIGREEAYKTVEAAARRTVSAGGSLADALAADPRVSAHFSRAELDAVVDPAAAEGAAQTFIDLALVNWAADAASLKMDDTGTAKSQ